MALPIKSSKELVVTLTFHLLTGKHIVTNTQTKKKREKEIEKWARKSIIVINMCFNV